MLHIAEVPQSHFAPKHVAVFGMKREEGSVKREEWGMKREDLFFLYNSDLYVSANV
jgi:hypothetical protein